MFKKINNRFFTIMCNIVLGLSLTIYASILVFRIPEIWFIFPLSVSLVFTLFILIAILYTVSELYYINKSKRIVDSI